MAGDDPPSPGDSAPQGAVTSLDRLERRIAVLEKAFADIVERHENSLRDRGSAFADVEAELLVERDHRIGIAHRERHMVVAAHAVARRLLRVRGACRANTGRDTGSRLHERPSR